MPTVQIDRIVSVSSQHAERPASNIFSEDNDYWTCKSRGEKQLSTIVQLKTSTRINSIHVGNYGSAFVEILVGKATSVQDNDFKVLLACSTLMSLQDSRAEKNMQTVQMFASDKLSADIQTQYWDRVKVVCTQPFNNHLYGLTFLKLMGETQDVSSSGATQTQSTSSQNPLGNLTVPELSTDPNPDTIKIGSFFKNRNAATASETMSIKTQGSNSGKTNEELPAGIQSKPTLASQLRNPSTSNSPSSKVSLDVSPKEPPRKIAKIEKTPSQTRISKKEPIRQQEEKMEKEKSISSGNRTNNSGTASEEKQHKKELNYAQFEKLFEGVVFCLSGFVNPTRGELRQKAMQMGAQFKQDWSPDCTHLICAFPNTPKFNQVKNGFSNARIVKKEWIEDCHSNKCKLNITQYSFIPVSTKIKEEPEVHVEIEKPVNNSIAVSSREEETSEDNVATVVASSSAYDAETDSEYEYEDQNGDDTAGTQHEDSELNPNGELPPLPDFFKRRKFFLFGEFSEDLRRKLKRLIIAYNGVLCPYMDEDINYIVTGKSWSSDFDDVLEENSSVQFIKPSWLFACDKQQKAVPIQYHIVPPS